MTETGRWLAGRGSILTLLLVIAGMLSVIGLVLLSFGVGVLGGRVGLYRSVPVLVLLGWVASLAAVGAGVFWVLRVIPGVRPAALAREIERSQRLRRGSIGGPADWSVGPRSVGLAGLADARASRWLQDHGANALTVVRQRARQSVAMGAAVLGIGAVFFVAVHPAGSGSQQFWHPMATLLLGRGPVSLVVEPMQVPRHDSVRVTVTATGRKEAALWVRAVGEPWATRPVRLDSAGVVQLMLGPLESDHFLRAVAGGRTSETVHVRVSLPVLLEELQLTARFPDYVERADELLAAGPDTVLLPVGTRILARGRVSVPIVSAEWRSEERSIGMSTSGHAFSGALRVLRNARWQLHVTTSTGADLDDEPPALDVIALADSAPQIAIPVPGADTTAPLGLRQPLVIDVRDDYGVSRVELVSWRVSRFGSASEPIVDSIPVPLVSSERLVLQWVLDLNGRGLLPGDTVRFKVRALDNAPDAHEGESSTFALWLPSMADLRESLRDQSRSMQGEADSLLVEQQQLARSLEDLATARERGADSARRGTTPTPEDLPFNSVQRATELSDRQQDALDRARRLQQELRNLSESAWSAGITDPGFHQQMRDLGELLDRALTEELRDRLAALRDAVEQLDAERVREALRELAESAEQLRADLERGRELFERAALEGELTSLTHDAQELSDRQREWNQTTERSVSDSLLAAQEDQLAQRSDSLAASVERLDDELRRSGDEAHLQSAADRAWQASQHMQQAAGEARRGERQSARRSGQSASESLEPLAQQLQEQRDQLRQHWRGEVLDAMDRALVETAKLAEQQERVMERMRQGESGSDVRAAQAATQAGVDQVLERLQAAAGKNALVSPQLGSALGLSRLKMAEAIDQLQRANPNTRQAAESAGDALDGLNALAHALLRSRSEVAGAESGSGLSEAMEQLAQLAEQQGQVNSASSGMLSMMPDAAQQLMQELQALARQERSLANQLEQLQAQGEITGADEMAEEARALAEQLEAARLDRETIERQERLFRRLLDAGRTLRSDEEDEREERVSQRADPRNVLVPSATQLIPPELIRFPYPTWQELRSLSPDERKLILDYFRRLNRGRP